MPITQSRLHRLLQAGEKYQSLWQTAYGELREQMAMVKRQQCTPDQALATMESILYTTDTTAAAIVLSEERVRYKLTSGKNTFTRGRKERQRRALGIPPRMPAGEPLDLGPSAPLREQQIAQEADDEDDAMAGLEDLGPGNAPGSPPKPPEFSGEYTELTESDKRRIEREIARDQEREEALARYNAGTRPKTPEASEC
jgi:hypothetical protein